MIARRLAGTLMTLLVAAALAACEPADEPAPEAEPGREATPGAPSEAGVVEVTAVDYAFQAPAEIPSGWTTFRMRNGGQEPHFLVLWRLPEGRTIEEYRREVVQPFEVAYDSLEAGAVDPAGAGEILGRLLPDWFASVEPMGGPGLVASGGVARTTVKLDPGTYVMECYVKSPEGEFHNVLGMLALLTVMADSTGATPPEADVEMTLTNTAIGTGAPVPAGERTIAVRFEEHPPAGLGNDVHVARLAEDTDLAEVARWMDWMNLEGLRSPAPVEFLGGAQEMPVGSAAYFTVTLEPGRYAWVSEATTAERLVEEFTVE